MTVFVLVTRTRWGDEFVEAYGTREAAYGEVLDFGATACRPAPAGECPVIDDPVEMMAHLYDHHGHDCSVHEVTVEPASPLPPGMPTYEELTDLYEAVTCDRYSPYRTDNGFYECEYCGQSQLTHRLISVLERVRDALRDAPETTPALPGPSVTKVPPLEREVTLREEDR